jgi:gluconolactonase
MKCRPSSILALLGLIHCGRVLMAAPPDTAAPDANLVEVYSDARFFEGPSWDPVTGKLYFTAIGDDRHTQILRLDAPGKVHVFQNNTDGVIGTYRSLDGRLLGAQSFGRSIVSYDFATGKMSVLAHDDDWNQPNDLCQTPSGDIFFTDPGFGEGKPSSVFRLSNSRATKIISDMIKPNGIIASKDGRTLYVSDSHEKYWKAFSISTDGSVGTGRIFFNPDTPNRDSPDGMSLDEQGNLYFAGRGGVWVVTPDGHPKGLIAVPEFCSNVTFGGQDGKTLYLTCSGKVYSLAMLVRGAQFAK